MKPAVTLSFFLQLHLTAMYILSRRARRAQKAQRSTFCPSRDNAAPKQEQRPMKPAVTLRMLTNQNKVRGMTSHFHLKRRTLSVEPETVRGTISVRKIAHAHVQIGLVFI